MPSCRAGDLCSGILQALSGVRRRPSVGNRRHIYPPRFRLSARQAVAFVAALIWSSYSVASSRLGRIRQTQSALLAWLRVSSRLWLMLFETTALPSTGEWLALTALGLGPSVVRFSSGTGPETRQRPCAWRHRLLRPTAVDWPADRSWAGSLTIIALSPPSRSLGARSWRQAHFPVIIVASH